MPTGEEWNEGLLLQSRLRVDGKFFRAGAERVFLKMVTYGPFPKTDT